MKINFALFAGNYVGANTPQNGRTHRCALTKSINTIIRLPNVVSAEKRMIHTGSIYSQTVHKQNLSFIAEIRIDLSEILWYNIVTK